MTTKTKTNSAADAAARKATLAKCAVLVRKAIPWAVVKAALAQKAAA